MQKILKKWLNVWTPKHTSEPTKVNKQQTQINNYLHTKHMHVHASTHPRTIDTSKHAYIYSSTCSSHHGGIIIPKIIQERLPNKGTFSKKNKKQIPSQPPLFGDQNGNKVLNGRINLTKTSLTFQRQLKLL